MLSGASSWKHRLVHASGLAILALAMLVGGCAPAGTTGPSITIGLGEEPGTLDGQTQSGNINKFALDYNVSEELVRLAPDGTLKPYLAESWQEVDANTLRFNLRQNVKFSDGTAFDAEAAKLSLDRVMRPESRVGSSELPAITEVKVAGKYTIDVIHKPDVSLIQGFTWSGAMYSPKQIRENPASIDTAPIGTGPFKIERWDKGAALILKARDDYWGKDLFGTPSIKNVKVVFRPEASVRVALIESGEGDLVTELLPDIAKRLDAAKVVNAEGLEVYNLRMGMKDSATSDVRVRRAISLAIDRQKLVALFAGFAKAPAGGQVWPSWTAGWANRPTEYDLNKAKALVQEAGAVGKEIDIAVSTGRWLLSGEVGDAVAGMIEQTGLKVKVNKMPHQQYLTRARELDNPPALLFVANGHERGDATQNLRSKFMCKGPMATNCQQEFDTLAEAAMAEPDRAKRTALVQKLADILERDVPITPLVIPGTIYGKNPKLEFKALPSGLLPVVDMKLGQ